MIRFLAITAALVAVFTAPAQAQVQRVPAGSWVWYYQHVQPADAAKFSGARAVVVANQTDDAAAVAEIHAQGALAFHYVNVFWYPTDRVYEGVDLSQNPGWAFCDSGALGTVGRVLAGAPWDYADLNERGLYDAVTTYLSSLRSAGYDGVFFDLGTLALGAGNMPGKVSSCTADPVAPGVTFADAYARVVKAAAAMGLHTVVNYTTRKPLRADVAAVVDRTLYETPSDTSLHGFATAFARRRAEQAATGHGPPRFVEEIKTSAAGDRAEAFLLWAQGALWPIDLTVNSGDDGCPGSPPGAECARYGTFPELTAVRRGAALDAAPSSLACQAGSAVRCLWIRRWQSALVAVNMTDVPVRAAITTGHRRCRVFTDVWRARVIHRSACTLALTVTVPARSGRVYTEATR